MANGYYGVSPTRLANSAGEGLSGPSVASMYNPEEMARYVQSMGVRQNAFNTAVAGTAETLKNILGTETYDPDDLMNMYQTFEGTLNDIVTKYGGDYSAAAPELAIAAARESGNPFFKFNKQKVDAMKIFQEDLRRIGPGMLVSGNDPREIKYADWQQGADLSYIPIDSKEVTQASEQVFKNFANALQSDSGFRETANGALLERVMKYGFSNPQEAMKFWNSGMGQQIYQQIYNSMPALGGVKNQGAVMDSIQKGVYVGIGKPDVNTYQNPEYLNPLQRAQLGEMGAEGVGMVTPAGTINRPEAYQDILTSPFFQAKANDYTKEVLKEMGITGVETYEELKAANQEAEKQLMKSGLGTSGSATFPGGRLESMVNQSEETINMMANLQNYENALKEIENRVKQDFPTMDLGLQLYDFNIGGASTTGELNRRQKVSDVLDTKVSTHLNKLVPFSSESRKALERIEGDVKVIGFNIHPVYGLYFAIEGTSKTKDKGGKKVTENAIVGVDPGDKDFFVDIISDISLHQPEFKRSLEEAYSKNKSIGK